MNALFSRLKVEATKIMHDASWNSKRNKNNINFNIMLNNINRIFLLTGFAFFLILLAVQGFSQDSKDYNNDVNTLFGDETIHGGYGAFTIGYTPIADRNCMTAGLKGAWIINHSLGLGIAGSGYFSEVSEGMLPDEEWSVYTGGQGGFLIEPILFGKHPVHLSFPIVIGGGAVFYGSDMLFYLDADDYTDVYKSYFDYYFSFEPGVELEFNLTHFFRLTAGVSYRFTSDVNISKTYKGIEYQILNNDDLQNFNVYLAFKFGKF